MIRIFTASDITAQTNLQPPGGYKWLLLSVLAWIVAGTTTGTRTLVVYHLPNSQPGPPSILLTPVISSSLNTAGDIISTLGSPGNSGVSGDANAAVQWGYEPEIACFDQIHIVPVLQAGDTVSYIINVNEVPS